VPDSEQHLIATYNILFQELKLTVLQLLDEQNFQLKREYEKAVAEKERRKQQALSRKQ